MKLSAGITIAACVSCAALVSAHLRTGDSINPELDPTSHDKFFGKDYPDDVRAPMYKHEDKLFKHPYPTIQDSDRYDKDYVKDENDDGGYWKEQMEYDRLKNLLAKEMRELQAALANGADLKAAVEKAKKAYEDALEKEAEAHKKEVAADAAHDKAHADLKEVKEDINTNTNEVEEEITDLKDCKNKLIEAKAKLKKLMADKLEAERKEAERQKEEDAKEVLQREAEKKEEALEKKLAEEQGEHQKALKSYEEEKADVKQVEADLEKAAEVLRKYRRADPDGGVYEVKSGVVHAGLAFPAVLAALVAAA